MANKWDRIFDSPKYLKRFLKDFLKTYESVSNGYKTSSSYSTDKYSEIIIGDCYFADSDFSLFIYDFKNLLENTKFTKTEAKYLRLWIRGYSEKEIGDYYGVLRRSVNILLIPCCKKIIEERKNQNGTTQSIY